MKAGLLKGARLTLPDGGITENTPRMLPDGLAAEIDWGSWPVLPSSSSFANSATFPMMITAAVSILDSE